MTIEIAKKDDTVKIFELYAMAIDFQKGVFEKQWEGFEPDLIEQELDEKRLWKICEGNEILCVFSINFNDRIFWGERDEEPSIYIHRIALNNNYRGISVMSKIIDWSRIYCSQNHKKYIRIDTWGDNPKLIGYYQRCGFELIETIDLDNTAGLPLHYKGKLALLEMIA